MYAVSANLLHDRRKNEKNDPENRGCYKEQSGALSAATLDGQKMQSHTVFSGVKKKDRMHMKKICLRMKNQP